MGNGLARAATVALICALAPAGSPAVAQAVLPDAGCPGPETSSLSVTTPDERDAQTFTAVHTGTLVRAQIQIHKVSASTDFRLQILGANASGVPVNGMLASTTIPDASVPIGTVTLDGTFSSPAQVVAGQQYALVVARPGGATYSVSERNGNPCSGSEWVSSTQTGTWGPAPDSADLDHIFQTFVNPPNDFSIVKLTGRRLTLEIPGAGQVTVADAGTPRSAQTVAASQKLLRTSSATAVTGGQLTLRLRLTRRAKALLLARGKVKLRVAITFAPTGGDPNTLHTKLKIKH